MKEQSALHHASAANHDTSAGERADQDAESSDSAAAFSASAFQHRGSSTDIELKHNNFCFSPLFFSCVSLAAAAPDQLPEVGPQVQRQVLSLEARVQATEA